MSKLYFNLIDCSVFDLIDCPFLAPKRPLVKVPALPDQQVSSCRKWEAILLPTGVLKVLMGCTTAISIYETRVPYEQKLAPTFGRKFSQSSTQALTNCPFQPSLNFVGEKHRV